MEPYREVTLSEVERALQSLGGEAAWPEIREQLVKIRGGDYAYYLNFENFDKSAFQIIQEHCPGYKKYKGPTRFEHVGKSKKKKFRLLFQVTRKGSGIGDPASTLHVTGIDVENGLWLQAEEADISEYTPQDRDRRRVVERQIRERRGWQQFRNGLRKRYGDRCLVTGCEVLAVLEAAHIKPYRGEEDNHLGNGLLLRADIHTLFDLDLLGIEPNSLHVALHPDLVATKDYGMLIGKVLVCRQDLRPSREALVPRYEQFEYRLRGST